MKHGGSVLANVQCERFRTRWCRGSCYCPFPSLLRKTKLRNDSGNFRRNADTLPDASFVSSVSVRSAIVNGSLRLIISG